MEKMTSRLAAAAVVAGVAVLGAGCAADAAAPAGGNPGSAPAGSPALPNPFTITARYSAKSLGLDHPDALAAGPDDNLYVTDLSQRVTVISPGGEVLRRWGKPGTGPGEFKFISGDPTDPTDVAGRIAVGRTGMVYVSDSGNGRVQVFTSQGRFIRQFGSYGSGKGQFFSPGNLVVDGSGRQPEPDPGQVLPRRHGHLADRRQRFQRPGPARQQGAGEHRRARQDRHGERRPGEGLLRRSQRPQS